jgi:hypothetical protein
VHGTRIPLVGIDIARNIVPSTRCKDQERSEKAVNRHAHIQSPGHSEEGAQG